MSKPSHYHNLAYLERLRESDTQASEVVSSDVAETDLLDEEWDISHLPEFISL